MRGHDRKRPNLPGLSAPGAAGVSLLELLVAVGLFTVLTAALLSWVWTFQHSSGLLNRSLERDENLRLAPLLLARYLSSAGNGQWGGSWQGIDTGDSMLRVQADIDGDEGFPDGRLDGRFERLWLSRSRSDLRLRSGGGSFQPLLTRITGFTVRRPAVTLLAIDVEGESSPMPGSPWRPKEILKIDFFLSNYRPSLLPPEDP